MVRLTRRRIAWIAALSLWAVIAAEFWGAFVSILPTARTNIGDPFLIYTVTSANELVIVRSVDARGMCGPLEYWDPRSGRKTGEWLGRDDVIDSYRISDSGELVIIREGRRYAVSPERKEILFEFPSGGPVLKTRVLPGRQGFLYSDGHSTHLFDPASQREIWSVSNSGLRSVGPDFMVICPSPPHLNSTGQQWATVLKLETGERDDRFDHLGRRLIQIDCSPDGRYAAVMSLGNVTVCDAKTGAKLWSLPKIDGLENVEFENQGNELCTDLVDSKDDVTTARWRSSDGMVLVPPPQDSGGFSYRFRTADGRFGVEYVLQKESKFMSLLHRWNDRLGLTLFPYVPAALRVLDLRSGARLGFMPSENQIPTMMPNGRGFVMQNGNAIELYDLPPRRNWAALMWWLLGPPAAIGFVLAAWRWSRRRLAVRIP